MFLTLPPYLYGAIYSFFYSLLALGPAFFYLISLSINKGHRSGAMFATGIVLSDIVLVGALHFGLGWLFEEKAFMIFFSLISGVILLVLGVKYLIKKEVYENKGKSKVKDNSLIGYCVKGFLMNISNPGVVFLWVILRGKLSIKHADYSSTETLILMGSFFGMLLFFEISKAVLAGRIGEFLTNRVSFILDKVLAFFFLGISMWLFFKLYILVLDYI